MFFVHQVDSSNDVARVVRRDAHSFCQDAPFGQRFRQDVAQIVCCVAFGESAALQQHRRHSTSRIILEVNRDRDVVLVHLRCPCVGRDGNGGDITQERLHFEFERLVLCVVLS